MYIYRPKSVVLEIPENEITYVLPNLETVRVLCGGYPNGVPEQSLIEWSLHDIFPAGKTFVDIGAHIGTYTLQYAKQPKVAQVWSFEAQTTTFDALNTAVYLNNLKNVKVNHCAIGAPNQVGDIDLRIINSDGGSSSVCLWPYYNAEIQLTETVQCKTLDSFNIQNIGLIKVDVEGNELEALQGAVNTLENSNWPFVMFEAWVVDWYVQKKQETIDFMKSLGYNIFPVNNYPEMIFCEKQR